MRQKIHLGETAAPVGPGGTLLVCLVIGLTSWFGIELTKEAGRIASFWPANGILLAIILCQPLRRWAQLLGAAYIGNVIADLYVGDSVSLALMLSACNSFEVLLAATCIRRDPRASQEDLLNFPTLIRLGVYGLLLAPTATALLAATILHLQVGADIARVFLVWMPGDALGIALLTPVILRYRRGYKLSSDSTARRVLTISMLLLVAGINLIVFTQSYYQLLFLIPPILMLTAFQSGFYGTTAAVALSGIIAITFTVYGFGPIGTSELYSIREKVALIQLFVASLIAMSYPAATTLVLRHRLLREIEQNEHRYKFLLDNTNDIIFERSADQRITFISPAVTRILGWDVAEAESMIGRDFLHPADLPQLDTPFEIGADGIERRRIDVRYRRKDGHYIWTELSSQIIRAPETGEFDGVIGTVRDISAQKAAEADRDRAFRELQKLADADALTGLANRRQFNTTIENEIRRSARSNQPLSLLMIDADHFKNYNDALGHLAGDNCLRQIATTISNCATRPGDLVARYGGEEFAVILPDTTGEGGIAMAERILLAIKEMGMPHPNSHSAFVTVSIGIATAEDDAQTPDQLIQCADSALYLAKKNGRDRWETLDDVGEVAATETEAEIKKIALR